MKWNKNLTKESYMHTAHKTECSIYTASSSILKPEISIGYQRRMERHMAFYQLLEKSNLFIKNRCLNKIFKHDNWLCILTVMDYEHDTNFVLYRVV